MIFVILAVCIAAVFAGLILADRCSELLGIVVFGCGVLGGIISIAFAITLCISVSEASVIDQKIAMYEEENAKIETQIADMVEKYQKYEMDIFADVKPENSMTMVSLYPELKSDVLVQAQINAHVANNENIKALKSGKLDSAIYRWWLYFGG